MVARVALCYDPHWVAGAPENRFASDLWKTKPKQLLATAREALAEAAATAAASAYAGSARRQTERGEAAAWEGVSDYEEPTPRRRQAVIDLREALIRAGVHRANGGQVFDHCSPGLKLRVQNEARATKGLKRLLRAEPGLLEVHEHGAGIDTVLARRAPRAVPRTPSTCCSTARDCGCRSGCRAVWGADVAQATLAVARECFVRPECVAEACVHVDCTATAWAAATVRTSMRASMLNASPRICNAAVTGSKDSMVRVSLVFYIVERLPSRILR